MPVIQRVIAIVDALVTRGSDTIKVLLPQDGGPGSGGRARPGGRVRVGEVRRQSLLSPHLKPGSE
jgi:ADP-ribose pyrophosphatase YjhB (NUDIX family)